MAAARRVQSRRRVWNGIHDNEPSNITKVCWEKILLESKNIADNQEKEKAKENFS
jgi:hypothetical protein